MNVVGISFWLVLRLTSKFLCQSQNQGGICHRTDKSLSYVSNEVVMAKIGFSVQLYCCVINSEFVGWLFLDNMVYPNAKYSLSYDKLINARILSINNVQESDAGKYLCQVKDSKNIVSNFPVLVHIKAYLTNQNPKYYVEVTKTERIPLNIIGIPFPTIQFYKANNLQTPLLETTSPSQKVKNGRYEIVSNGDIVIHNLQVSDTGQYLIRLNQEGGLTSDEYTIEIIAGARPFVAYIPKPFYNFTISQNGIIPARFSGDFLNIYWKFTSNIFGEKTERIMGDTDDKYFVGVDGSLTVINVDINDAGKYVGICSNPWGEVQVSSSVLYTIRAAQIEQLNNAVGGVGENTSFTVKVSGSPTPSIMWFRNGVQLKGQRVSDTTSILKLDFIQRNDAGIYTCIADNGATSNGQRVYASKNVTLYVTGFPVMEIQKSTPLVITTKNRVMVRLLCVASGYALSDIVFMKGNQTFAASSKGASRENADTFFGILDLTIDSPDKIGNYTCVATNPFGTSFMTIQVKYFEFPKPPTGIRIAQINPTSVVITWDTVEKGPSQIFYSYIASIWGTGYRYGYSINTTDTSVTFTTLQKGQTFYFSVRTFNQAGWSEPSSTLTFVTPNLGRPSPPQILNRDIFLNNVNLRLYWGSPMDDGGSQFITYTVRRCIWDLEKIHIDRNCETFDGIRSNEMIFNGLISFQLYDFYVIATNQIESSLPARYQVFTGSNARVGIPGKTSPQVIAISILLATFLFIFIFDLILCLFFRAGILYWLIHACAFFPLCLAEDKVPLRKDSMIPIKSQRGVKVPKSIPSSILADDTIKRTKNQEFMVMEDQIYQEIIQENGPLMLRPQVELNRSREKKNNKYSDSKLVYSGDKVVSIKDNNTKLVYEGANTEKKRVKGSNGNKLNDNYQTNKIISKAVPASFNSSEDIRISGQNSSVRTNKKNAVITQGAKFQPYEFVSEDQRREIRSSELNVNRDGIVGGEGLNIREINEKLRSNSEKSELNKLNTNKFESSVRLLGPKQSSVSSKKVVPAIEPEIESETVARENNMFV